MMTKNPTYEVRHGRVVRTAGSMERKEKRDVAKEPRYPLAGKHPQETADERWLSRSKPYFNKGVNEAARRVRQMARDSA